MKSKETGKKLSKYYKEMVVRVGRNLNTHLKEQGEKLSIDSITSFLEKRKEELSKKTFYIRLNALKSLIVNQAFIKELHEGDREEIIHRIDECFSLKKNKVIVKDVRERVSIERNPLSDEEVQDLLISTTDRNRLILRFLLTTGCFLNEIVNLKNSKIKKIAGKVAKIDMPCKYNRDRTLYVPAELIRSIRAEFGKSGLLFKTRSDQPIRRNNIRRHLERATKKSSLNKEVTIKMLRDTCRRKLEECGKYTQQQIDMYLCEPVSGHSEEQIGPDVVQEMK